MKRPKRKGGESVPCPPIEKVHRQPSKNSKVKEPDAGGANVQIRKKAQVGIRGLERKKSQQTYKTVGKAVTRGLKSRSTIPNPGRRSEKEEEITFQCKTLRSKVTTSGLISKFSATTCGI